MHVWNSYIKNTPSPPYEKDVQPNIGLHNQVGQKVCGSDDGGANIVSENVQMGKLENKVQDNEMMGNIIKFISGRESR